MKNRRLITALTLGTLTSLTASQDAHGFAYIFAGEGNGIDVITHPIGYTGTGGNLFVTVGVDPTSTNAANMLISVQNVVNTWNGMTPTTSNLGEVLLSADNSVVAGGGPVAQMSSGSLISQASDTPALVHSSCSCYSCAAVQASLSTAQSGTPGGSQVDFESVLLHEMGHSIGLAHPNAATESGLPSTSHNYTKATDGANNVFDLNPGPDGVIGSHDDIRGDDVNLNYFHKATNDPFATANANGVVDSTTYSRDVTDLPVGDTFSTNADRTVSTLLRYNEPGTEAVMQQGTFGGETQRTLTADDVAGIKYAESGLDEIAGTADDYNLILVYNGLDASADIVIDFDNAETGFAVSKSTGAFLPDDHIRITSNDIYFNTGFNWYFNDELTVIPEPNTLAPLAIGGLLVARRRRRA